MVNKYDIRGTPVEEQTIRPTMRRSDAKVRRLDASGSVTLPNNLLLGAFRLFGKEMSERERLARSSMVFQDVNYQLFAESVAAEVVFGIPKDRARSVDVEGILSSLGLRDVSGRHPATLSGGQKQRLAVASCVAAGKDVLVFDEPTSGLDLESMRRVASLIRRLADEGRVVLVVTHDLEFIACACDRAVELSEGVVAGSYDVAGGVGAIRRALFVDSQCDDWT